MAIPWKKAELRAVEQGIAKHPVTSGRCAALARIIHRLAINTDRNAHGIQLRPPRGARFLVPKHAHVPRIWRSHTLVTTQKHNIDAITGAQGHDADEYLAYYWEYPDVIGVQRVDVETVDPGIQGCES